jgi:hypothetical protein
MLDPMQSHHEAELPSLVLETRWECTAARQRRARHARNATVAGGTPLAS